MHNLGYFLKEALVSSKRNFGTAVGAIITIYLSLFIIGIFLVGSVMINGMVQEIENQVTISVFLSDDAKQEDITDLEDKIRGDSRTLSISYISKSDALEKFKSMSNSGIVEQLDGNPLPASFEIELRDPQLVEDVANTIRSYASFNKVIDSPDDPEKSLRYGQQIIEKLFAVADIIRVVCIFLVLLLVFVALVFINNTIRLAILARRKEIAIMRLVGASNGFIRGPYLTEGALHSLIGAALAVITLIIVATGAASQLSNLFIWLPLDYNQGINTLIYIFIVVIGLLIGLFGSALALRRFLKV